MHTANKMPWKSTNKKANKNIPTHTVNSSMSLDLAPSIEHKTAHLLRIQDSNENTRQLFQRGNVVNNDDLCVNLFLANEIYSKSRLAPKREKMIDFGSNRQIFYTKEFVEQ